MILSSIQLYNFRQFYDASPIIEFSSGKQNVTVIHGINGSGKTALLNAFTWVLYEEHTRDFYYLINSSINVQFGKQKSAKWWNVGLKSHLKITTVDLTRFSGQLISFRERSPKWEEKDHIQQHFVSKWSRWSDRVVVPTI